MSNIIVRLQDVNIKQGTQEVLNGVNLRINAGEFSYLIGKTGSGKSSLIKSLYGAHRISTGTATVCDFNLSELVANDIPYLRRKIGIVFQDFQLLPDQSVFQNLWLVLKATGWEKESADKRIDEVLNEVGLLHIKGKHPMQLSGGEQQRVVIARALLNEPQLLIADEPTGNLDAKTGAKILDLLLRTVASGGKTLVVITHDMNIAKQMDVIYRLEDGKLVPVTTA